VEHAERIIDEGVQSFVKWLEERNIVPLIQQLNAQAHNWQTIELAKAKKLLAKGESVEAVLESLAKGLSHKMLHGAMSGLHHADTQSREASIQAVQHFFLRESQHR
jgi:glutamyl-tRNA reductase